VGSEMLYKRQIKINRG